MKIFNACGIYYFYHEELNHISYFLYFLANEKAKCSEFRLPGCRHYFFVNWEIERLVEQYMRSLVLQPLNTKLAPIDQNLG